METIHIFSSSPVNRVIFLSAALYWLHYKTNTLKTKVNSFILRRAIKGIYKDITLKVYSNKKYLGFILCA